MSVWSKMLNWVKYSLALLAIWVLWKFFELGTVYLELYVLRRIVGALLVIGMGGFVIHKKTGLASALKAGDDVLRQHMWSWIAGPALSLRVIEFVLQFAGWIFILFGILVAIGVIPDSFHYSINKKFTLNF